MARPGAVDRAPARWTEQEQALWHTFRSGDRLDLTPLGGGEAVHAWTDWSPQRTISAQVLTTLLLRDPARGVDRGCYLRLNGARIRGCLALDGAIIEHQIELTNCYFDEPILLRGARTRRISLAGSWVRELRLHNVDVDGELAFDRIHTLGLVDLADASIKRSVRLIEARLSNHHGPALMAERLRTDGALLCQGLDATGEIRLPGARIGGIINLAGAHLRSRRGTALDGNGLSVGGSLFCDPRRGRSEGLRTIGRIFLGGARIDGDLDLTAAVLRPSPDLDERTIRQPAGPNADADSDPTAVLVAERAVINGNLEIDGNFEAHGTVRLATATIRGNIRASECLLDPALPRAGSGQDRFALLADGLELGGELLASPGFRATGELLLRSAQIGGNVFLAGAELENPGRNAINLDRTTIRGNLTAWGLKVRGTVRLQNTVVGGTVLFDGANLTEPYWLTERDPDAQNEAPVRPSLDARSIQVGRDFLCQMGRSGLPFRAAAGVRLRGAEVRKAVSFRGAQLYSGGRVYALNLAGLRSAELLLALDSTPVGAIQLARARVATLYDNKHLWAATGGLSLDNFEYNSVTIEVGSRQPVPDHATAAGHRYRGWLHRTMHRLDHGRPGDVRERVDWLRAGLSAFRPEHGRRPDTRRWWRRWFGRTDRHTGYNPQPYEQLAASYRADGNVREARYVLLENQRHRRKTLSLPGRMFGGLLDVTVGYGYRTWLALIWLAGLWAIGYWYMSGLHPTPIDENLVGDWSPGLFALDLLLPIIGFEQEGIWTMVGSARWVAAGLELAGWLLATAVLAGLTTLLQRRDA
ncbi:MAG TPA: hypothetical protein VKG85_10085 [Actinomycetes bacterium]|nr:hypothetical protein [Actinomycetes bacterium]